VSPNAPKKDGNGGGGRGKVPDWAEKNREAFRVVVKKLRKNEGGGGNDLIKMLNSRIK